LGAIVIPGATGIEEKGTIPKPEENHEWTRIDTNRRTLTLRHDDAMKSRLICLMQAFFCWFPLSAILL
jgi:hypothetical protein